MQFSRNHLHKSIPCTEKRLRKPQTCNKVGCEEMEHEFPFGIFCPENNRTNFFTIFRCSLKCHVSFTFQPDLPETFLNGKQPMTLQSDLGQ